MRIYAESGCCSNHNGVDKCDEKSGKYLCNDGTLSKTCVCKINASNYNPSKSNKNNINRILSLIAIVVILGYTIIYSIGKKKR